VGNAGFASEIPIAAGGIAGLVAADDSCWSPSRLRRCASATRRLDDLSVTSIDGEFERRDFGRKINLEDGTVLTCAEYNYTYSYSPDAVVFGKRTSFNGRTFISLRLVGDDEVFELEPKAAKD
jgi:hypothetical protein